MYSLSYWTEQRYKHTLGVSRIDSPPSPPARCFKDCLNLAWCRNFCMTFSCSEGQLHSSMANYIHGVRDHIWEKNLPLIVCKCVMSSSRGAPLYIKCSDDARCKVEPGVITFSSGTVIHAVGAKERLLSLFYFIFLPLHTVPCMSKNKK